MQMLNAALQQHKINAGPYAKHRHSKDEGQQYWRAGVDSKSIVTVVGILPPADKGQQLRFVGDWVVHAKHGWQLKATAYEEVEPKSPKAVAAYLSSTIDGESSQHLLTRDSVHDPVADRHCPCKTLHCMMG